MNFDFVKDAAKGTAEKAQDLLPPYGVPRNPEYTVEEYKTAHPDDASKKLMACTVRKGMQTGEWQMAGISLEEKDGEIFVKEIKLTSPFKRRTALQEGDKVYAINGVSDFGSVSDAEKFIIDAEEVSIITDWHDIAGGVGAEYAAIAP